VQITQSNTAYLTKERSLRSSIPKNQRRRLCAGDGYLGFGVAQPPSLADTCTFS